MTKPRTRQEARQIAAASYFTGKPCRYGHLSNRTTSTARCEECNRIFNREHKRRQAAAKRNRTMTLPATREAAMIAGSQLYDTMKPCRRGHSSPRYTSNAICVVCKKAHAKSPKRAEADARQAMLPKSWKEAQEKGAPRYFTGIECRKGHISERATSNGGCIECGKERYAKAGSSDQGDGMTLSERILVAAKNKVPVSKIIKSLPQHKAKNVRTEIDNMTRHGGPLERFKDGSVQSRVVVDNSGRPVFGKNRNMAWFNATLEDVRNGLGVG